MGKEMRRHKVQVMLNDEQIKLVERYAQERCMTKAEAVRTMIDMRRRQDVIKERDK